MAPWSMPAVVAMAVAIVAASSPAPLFPMGSGLPNPDLVHTCLEGTAPNVEAILVAQCTKLVPDGIPSGIALPEFRIESPSELVAWTSAVLDAIKTRSVPAPLRSGLIEWLKSLIDLIPIRVLIDIVVDSARLRDKFLPAAFAQFQHKPHVGGLHFALVKLEDKRIENGDLVSFFISQLPPTALKYLYDADIQRILSSAGGHKQSFEWFGLVGTMAAVRLCSIRRDDVITMLNRLYPFQAGIFYVVAFHRLRGLLMRRRRWGGGDGADTKAHFDREPMMLVEFMSLLVQRMSPDFLRIRQLELEMVSREAHLPSSAATYFSFLKLYVDNLQLFRKHTISCFVPREDTADSILDVIMRFVRQDPPVVVPFLSESSADPVVLWTDVMRSEFFDSFHHIATLAANDSTNPDFSRCVSGLLSATKSALPPMAKTGDASRVVKKDI